MNIRALIRIIFKAIVFIFLVVLASCIDPYTHNLKNYKSLLVVEGLITNENVPYTINLVEVSAGLINRLKRSVMPSYMLLMAI